MDDLDLDKLARQLGNEAAVDARTLQRLEQALRDSGYLKRTSDGQLKLSPKAMRQLGRVLLRDVATRMSGRQGQRDLRRAGAAGELSGGFAAPDGTPRGAVLVVHENRGLTDHIRAVAGRLAGDGYAALAPDLLSRVGGTAGVPDATAALGGLGEADLISDLQSGLTELGRRLPGVPQAAMGFCFGGGMVWRLLNGAPTELAAAVPFYGPAPAEPTFANTRAAVLGVFAELDNRVNAGRDVLDAALTARGLTHEMVTVPGVDHAFFNDTGPRFNAAAAATTYQRVLDWFGRYLTT
jgi:carboxymethylenebutenolidase